MDIEIVIEVERKKIIINFVLLELQVSLLTENQTFISDKQASSFTLVSSFKDGYSDIYSCVSSAYSKTEKS